MELTRTDRTTVHRQPERGQDDRDVVCAILDEALVCHVGFIIDDQPLSFQRLMRGAPINCTLMARPRLGWWACSGAGLQSALL
jgi:hypothetical protein